MWISALTGPKENQRTEDRNALPPRHLSTLATISEIGKKMREKETANEVRVRL